MTHLQSLFVLLLCLCCYLPSRLLVVGAPLECNATLAQALAERFRKLGRKGRDSSFCPEEEWLPLMAASSARANKQHYIFINIGFNKGYNFANWMQLFAPSTYMTPAVWWRKLVEGSDNSKNVTVPWQAACGECKDCNVVFETGTASRLADAANVTAGGARRPRIDIIGVDLNEDNIKLVHQIAASIRADHRGNSSAKEQPNFEAVSLDLRHAAASNKDGIMAIEKCPPGKEMCAIPSVEQWNASLASQRQRNDRFHHVRVLTADSLCKEVFARLRGRVGSKASSGPGAELEIDILMIDTEGNDALVLAGAHDILSRRLVRCVIFEYHYFGQWEFKLLKDSVDALDGHGYDCWFQGQRRLWSLSHGCWHALYEFKGWSNVMCVRRGDPWMAVVEPLVVSA